MIYKIQVVTIGEDGREETREITSIQTDRCEAGDAWPYLGRGQNDIEGPAADRSRISGVELTVAKAVLS
jgi:hypothetical protein